MPKQSSQKKVDLLSTNRKLVKKLWGASADSFLMQKLRELTKEFSFSISRGELTLLNANWYVTHAGLLGLAARRHCSGIHVEPVLNFSDSAASRFAFKATVYKPHSRMGFIGYGDADPSNVSPVVHGAEMRVAETRAVNRALRKAYGIGICSV